MRNRGFFYYFLLIRTNCGLFLLVSLAINNDAERINASASTKSPPVVMCGKRVFNVKRRTQLPWELGWLQYFAVKNAGNVFYDFSLEAFLFFRNLKMQLFAKVFRAQRLGR